MDSTKSAPCIPDEGIAARIPGSPFSVLSLIEVRNRLSGDASEASPLMIGQSMNLSLSQVYAALAYYHANQGLFDGELERRQETSRQRLAELFTRQEGRSGWGDLAGKWPGDETDAEIEAALEQLS